jgi:NAD(P)-dependent dehydrogenase (short-subunit alcohol dehydrogenase family)
VSRESIPSHKSNKSNTFVSSGIGLALTKQLARKGANVYLAARSESKATGAIAQIEIELAKSGVRLIPGQLEWARLDLDDPKEAYKCGKALAERIKSKYNRLDVLGE